MAFGMRAHDIKADSIADLCRKCEQLGVHTLQLALLKSVAGLKPGCFNPGLARDIKRELDGHGIHISVLGCYINPVDPNPEVRRRNLKLFEEHIQFAAYLGADMIGTETVQYGVDEAAIRSEEAYGLLLDSMRRLTRYAAARGVMVGVEPVSVHTLYSPKRMKQFLDDMDAPNLSVIFDPVNLIDASNYARQQELMQRCFDLFGERIAAVHAKDFVMQEGKKKECPAGDGELDYPFLLEWLGRNKPGIDIILEGVTEPELPRVRAAMQTLWDSASPEDVPM